MLLNRSTLLPAQVAGADDPIRRHEGHWPWLIGASALLPFLYCIRSFADIWWFGDEWDQLDQIARQGFWHWTLSPFGENVVPLFKTAWGGLARVAGGSYFPMLAAVWINHALNTGLLARVLRTAGFGWAGIAVASVAFGVSVANAEVLCWSVQWSNVLATSFLLLAFERFLRYPPRPYAWDLRRNGLLACLAAASALTFVRGVLTAFVLAVGALLLVAESRPHLAARWRAAVLYLAPTCAVIAWLFLAAAGNHHELGREDLWWKAAEFALWFWAAVPFHRLADLSDWNGSTTALLGAVKFILVASALYRARGRPRLLLALFLLFDLGNAALLGIGRYQTGLPFANSSRYYYSALICSLPFVAWHCDAWLEALRNRTARTVVAAAVVVLVAFRVARHWPAEAELFAQRRGRDTRQILLHDPAPPPEGAVPGIPFLSTARAKELITLYHLH